MNRKVYELHVLWSALPMDRAIYEPHGSCALLYGLWIARFINCAVYEPYDLLIARFINRAVHKPQD